MRYLLLFLSLLYFESCRATAWGTACTYTTANYTISLPPGIKISIDPNAPAGTVFFEYLVPQYTGSTYLCGNTILSLTTQQTYKHDSGGTTTTLTGHGLEGTWDVYKTNIAGVGVVVRHAAFAFPWSGQKAVYVNETINVSPLYSYVFDVNIVKYGDIPVGASKVTIDSTVVPDILNTLVITGSSDVTKHPNGQFLLKRYTFSPVNIDILASTCDTPNRNVNLGERQISDSTNREDGKFASPWVDASIQLVNCPVFHGTGERGHFKGTTRKNIMTVTLVPSNASTSNKGIIPLDSGTLAAAGVGIQMAWGTSASPQLVDFSSGKGAKTFSMSATQGANYTVPLVARYMQTAAERSGIQVGAANGKVTYLVNYY